MTKKPKPETKTAIERVREAAAEAGVKVKIVEPKPGTGAVTLLARRSAEDPLEDDDGSGAVE